MNKRNKEIVLIIILMFISIISIKIISGHKEVEEEKEINKINKKQFAMYIEDGDSYKEFTESDNFPVGYTLNIGKSKCEDISGNNLDVNNILSGNGNSVTVKSNKTVYCTLYFDYKGTGEKDQPYRIQYIEDLVELSKAVNDEGNHYEGQYFYLARDLDFKEEGSYRDYQTTKYGDINKNSQDEELKTELTTEAGWIPIGYQVANDEKYFSGIFNGNNFTIANLYINNQLDADARLGLFGRINNGIVKNLVITGSIKTTPNSICGGVVGLATGFSTLDNLHNQVSLTSLAAANSLGGVVGESYDSTRITNSDNKANVTGGNSTGGIIGFTNYSTLTIENCYNSGTIRNDIGFYVGGILGRDNSVEDNTTIKNCYNNGTVIANNPNDLDTFTGGLIGKISGVINVDNSYNKGIVKNERISYSTDHYYIVGGLVGYIKSGNSKINYINNSHNEGNVTGGNRTGGILAYNDSSNTIINSCYNIATIESKITVPTFAIAVSGIVGYNGNNSKLMILNSYNSGSISSTKGAQGILHMDYGGMSYIINSYNVGTINGLSWSTGLYNGGGNTGNQVILKNVYNLGNLTGNLPYALGQNYGTTNVEYGYYLNNLKGSNVGNLGTGMAEANMKSASFASTLNTNRSNLNKIGLSSIDSNLNGYTLRKWVFGPNNYPILAKEGITDLSGKGGIAESFGAIHDEEGITTNTEQHLGHIDLGLANQNFGKALTFVVRVRINEDKVGALINNQDAAGGVIMYEPGNKLTMALYSVEKGNYVNTERIENIEIGKWYTIVGTYDGSNMKIYINGKEEIGARLALSDNIKPSSADIVLGANPGTQNSNYIDYGQEAYATYSDALVFNRALTAEEIKENYSEKPNPVNKTNLLAWYDFRQN